MTLFRFGAEPQSVERLPAEAEKAGANPDFGYGVSTMSKLPAKFAASGEYGSALASDVRAAGFGVAKTGSNPVQYTVLFPTPSIRTWPTPSTSCSTAEHREHYEL
jgi:hypothetical protein